MARQEETNTRKWKPANAAIAAAGTQGALKFIRPGELAEAGYSGVVAEGTFLKAVPNQIDNTKSDYYIALEDGSTAVLNSTGSLANQMKNVRVGDLIQVIYQGMKKLTTGRLAGKSVHQYLVNIAE